MSYSKRRQSWQTEPDCVNSACLYSTFSCRTCFIIYGPCHTNTKCNTGYLKDVDICIWDDVIATWQTDCGFHFICAEQSVHLETSTKKRSKFWVIDENKELVFLSYISHRQLYQWHGSSFDCICFTCIRENAARMWECWMETDELCYWESVACGMKANHSVLQSKGFINS